MYIVKVSKQPYYTNKWLKVLCSGTVVRPQSIKQLYDLHTLERAYVEHEKACIAKQEVENLNKVVKAKTQAMQQAMQQAAKAVRQASTQVGAHGYGRHSRCSGDMVRVLQALQQGKFYNKEAEIGQIKCGI